MDEKKYAVLEKEISPKPPIMNVMFSLPLLQVGQFA